LQEQWRHAEHGMIPVTLNHSRARRENRSLEMRGFRPPEVVPRLSGQDTRASIRYPARGCEVGCEAVPAHARPVSSPASALFLQKQWCTTWCTVDSTKSVAMASPCRYHTLSCCILHQTIFPVHCLRVLPTILHQCSMWGKLVQEPTQHASTPAIAPGGHVHNTLSLHASLPNAPSPRATHFSDRPSLTYSYCLTP
jgi:hypothetical protein